MPPDTSGVQAFWDQLQAVLPQIATPKTFDRYDFLTREGQIEHNIYFIESGAVRATYLTEVEEHTIRFGYKNSFINAVDSWLSNQPSQFYLQAIRKTKTQIIKRADFYNFVNEVTERQTQYTRFLELSFVQAMEREIDLLTFSPMERLQRLQKRSPQVFQEIPAKYIAAYLRMKPETLSRIMKS